MIVKIKGHKIDIYDDIELLPIRRFNKMNKYIMISSDVGSTFSDYDQKTEKALAFLHKGMVKEAMQELNNRRQAVFNAFNEYSPRNRAFALLVKKIDDTTYNDFTTDGLDKVIDHLDKIGFSFIDLVNILNEVKKK